MLNPCKDCPKRHKNCHSKCKEYEDMKDERVKIKDFLFKCFKRSKEEEITIQKTMKKR